MPLRFTSSLIKKYDKNVTDIEIYEDIKKEAPKMVKLQMGFDKDTLIGVINPEALEDEVLFWGFYLVGTKLYLKKGNPILIEDVFMRKDLDPSRKDIVAMIKVNYSRKVLVFRHLNELLKDGHFALVGLGVEEA